MGADYTLISQSDAVLLGIEYGNLNQEELRVEVANMSFIHVKKIDINLEIHEKIVKVPIFIARENVENLLGRKGFFDVFDILFQENKKQVVLMKSL